MGGDRGGTQISPILRGVTKILLFLRGGHSEILYPVLWLFLNGRFVIFCWCFRRPQHNSPLCWLTWYGQLKSARFLVNAGWDLAKESWLQLPGKNKETEEFLKWARELLRQPKTLFSTCRKSIREHMINVSNDKDICPGIQALPLPPSLKRFLQLEEEVHLLDQADWGGSLLTWSSRLTVVLSQLLGLFKFDQHFKKFSKHIFGCVDLSTTFNLCNIRITLFAQNSAYF